MDFNFKALCYIDFHNFCCALPEDTIDMEMTIYTYRRDQTTQMTSYSPWGREVKPFSSLRKKIADYKEEKNESCEKRNSNPFTSIRENKSGKKRSRRSQMSRKYRKLDMGCSAPTTAASECLTMANITFMTSLSAPVSSGPLSTSNILPLPKLPVHRPPYKMWAICHPTPVLLSCLYTQTGPQRRTGMASNKRGGRQTVKS